MRTGVTTRRQTTGPQDEKVRGLVVRGPVVHSSRDWLSVQEAADKLGFSSATIREHREELGAYRFGRGPFRIPRARVEFFHRHPEVLRAPKATIASLYQRVEQLNLLSQERENRVAERLAKIEKQLQDARQRVPALEAA